MNNKRRKAIVRQHDIIGNALEALRDLCSEEQDYLDGIPDNLAGSPQAVAAQDAIDALESAMTQLEDVQEALVSSIGGAS